jgi:hypothetical protein
MFQELLIEKRKMLRDWIGFAQKKGDRPRAVAYSIPKLPWQNSLIDCRTTSFSEAPLGHIKQKEVIS